LSKIEADNLGNGDVPVDYVAMLNGPTIKERGAFARGIQRIGKFCTALKPTRTQKDRDKAAYALHGISSDQLEKINEMDRIERLTFLDDEFDRGVIDEHPWKQFRKGGV
jgi:hypothetical protein